MKVYFELGLADTNPAKCFTTQHMLLPLLPSFERVDRLEDAEKLVFLDFGHTNYNHKADLCQKAKHLQLKVIVTTFDPANFQGITLLESSKLVDHVIVFDKKYLPSFRHCSFSDYWLNANLFPPEAPVSKDRVCVFGNLENGRVLPPNIDKIDVDRPDLVDLYKRVQQYYGVLVFDSGRLEGQIIHHNKAKALEALMCGRNAYCKAAIKSPTYSQFYLPFDEFNATRDINIPLNEIKKLNSHTINTFCETIQNI